MFLARVIGRVVATRKSEGLEGVPLLIVQPLDEQREACAPSVIACDAANSGVGEIVHVCDGRESTYALPVQFVPVDATIVGHVEQFDHDGAGPRPNAADPTASAHA
jgi:ethanolamine utilization protein EutN